MRRRPRSRSGSRAGPTRRGPGSGTRGGGRRGARTRPDPPPAARSAGSSVPLGRRSRSSSRYTGPPDLRIGYVFAMVPGPVLGVDFGTSNTVAVLRWPDGRIRPLLFDGSPVLPSAVYASDTGLATGRDAERSARIRPDAFEPNPKRRVDDGTVLLGGRELRVVDLFAAVLRRVLAEASRVAGGAPAGLVLTHPAAWGPPRCDVLVQAAV